MTRKKLWRWNGETADCGPYTMSVEAAAAMDRLLGPATEEQHRIAAAAGCTLEENLPQLVAATRLREAMLRPLWMTHQVYAFNDHYWDQYFHDFPDARRCVRPLPQTIMEANAWREQLLRVARLNELRRLKLNAGDVVEKSGTPGRKFLVSSISVNGAVWFKGGAGARAWPDSLKLLARASHSSASASVLRAEAEEHIAQHERAVRWSEAKMRVLRDFRVVGHLNEALVGSLEQVIDSATDERPIQSFIEEHPQLLTALLGADETYAIPQASLAGKFIPDFMIADVDSSGIRWAGVELETPISGMRLKTKHKFEQHTDEGIRQIGDWRDWVRGNLATARRHRDDGGAMLLDIEPDFDGLVIVGRRSLLHPEAASLRRRAEREHRLQIWTYDRLLERLRGMLTVNGPPAYSEHALRRPREIPSFL